MSELPGWLREPGLQPVWLAVRERLQRNGIEPHGKVTLRDLDRPARHAVSGLLGRPVLRETVRVDLAELDEVIGARSGGGLVAVVAALTGPLTDRVALRSDRDAARQAPFTAVRAWLDAHPGAAREWTEPWLAAVRSAGILSRMPDGAAASRALVQAAQVAAELTEVPPPPGAARNELAARHTGDAHALDDGAVCGALVLRALALVTGSPSPRSPAERRGLWESVGVSSDRVSTTVLTLGLQPVGSGPLARRLQDAAAVGDPVHLTAWDLDRAAVAVATRTAVLVCENPRVLEAAATRHGGAHAVVCTSGMPATVALTLLEQLAAAGAHLRYHGDFDWAGVAIANRLVQRVGCVPWRMSAADYTAAVSPDGLPLTGSPVQATWDDELGPAMLRAGLAVHEEAVLEELLRGLPELAVRRAQT